MWLGTCLQFVRLSWWRPKRRNPSAAFSGRLSGFVPAALATPVNGNPFHTRFFSPCSRLPCQSQLYPKATLPSSTEATVRPPPFNERRWIQTSCMKRDQQRLKATLSHRSIMIEAKTFTLRQKSTIHGSSFQLSEHRPSLSCTILLLVSTLGWFKNTISESIDVRRSLFRVASQRYYKTESRHLIIIKDGS